MARPSDGGAGSWIDWAILRHPSGTELSFGAAKPATHRRPKPASVEEFPLECPNCGGDIRLIAFITEPGPIRKILAHLGEPLEPPPVSPARGQPTDWGELVPVHDHRGVF
jgi:hypothetical protein